MSVSQMVREVQTTTTWGKIFPAEQKTEAQSLLFVKKLLSVGISNITYLRTLFPESSYDDRNLDGLQLKMLLEKSASLSSNMVVSWLKGCFEAIEKQYLRQLTFIIYADPDNPELALETYTFKFQYTMEAGPIISELEANSEMCKKERKFAVKKSTEKMLRTILLLTQTLKPLPRKVHLAMKLGYYDNVTPPDYEPPGFMEGGRGTLFDSIPVHIKVGDVSTRFHTVKLRVSVDKSSYSNDELSASNTQDERQKSILDDTVQSSECTDSLMRSFSGRSVAHVSPTKPMSPVHSSKRNHIEVFGGNNHESGLMQTPKTNGDQVMKRELKPSLTPNNNDKSWITREFGSQLEDWLVPQASQTLSSGSQQCARPVQSSNVRTPCLSDRTAITPGSAHSTTNAESQIFSGETEFTVRCPCGVNQDDGLMILCDFCNKWQHALCFNVLKESEAPAHHICEACGTSSTPSTDPTLKDHPELEMICLYRRTLVFLRDNNCRITAPMLGQRLGVNITIARELMKWLQKDKLLKKKGKLGTFPNCSRVINFAFPQYLYRVEEKEITGSDTAVSDTVQTPHSIKLSADIDTDATPDLPISSLRASMEASTAEEDMEQLKFTPGMKSDIPNDSQVLSVGSQRVVSIDNGLQSTLETAADTVATAGDTMATFGTQLTSGENSIFWASLPTQCLVKSEFDGDCLVKSEFDGDCLVKSEFDGNNMEVSTGDIKAPKDHPARGKRRILIQDVQISHGKKTVPSHSMALRHFETCDSQNSDTPQEQMEKMSTTTNISV